MFHWPKTAFSVHLSILSVFNPSAMYSVLSIMNGKSLFTLLHLAKPCFAGYMQHEDLWNMVCEALMMTDIMNMG